MAEQLGRWRERGRWRIPGRVAFVGSLPISPGDPAVAVLRAAGLDVVAAAPDGLDAAVGDADVVVAAGVRVDGALLARMPRCRLLTTPYVGYDHLDVAAAAARGILVANNPDGVTEEVANHALALILALNRGLFPMDRFVRVGAWPERRYPALELHRPGAQTLGIVGLGAIGRLVAERARPFGYRLVSSDPFVAPEVAASLGVTLLPLDDLLRQSDVVTLHVLLSDATRGLLSAERLARMKPGAVLINTCRGPVVDEAALVEALRSGHLAGAGLDVFETEPLPQGSPLLAMEQVILTPHAANLSVEGHREQRRRAGEIARSVALGGLPERRVVITTGLYDQIASLPELADLAQAAR